MFLYVCDHRHLAKYRIILILRVFMAAFLSSFFCRYHSGVMFGSVTTPMVTVDSRGRAERLQAVRTCNIFNCIFANLRHLARRAGSKYHIVHEHYS